MSHTTDSITFEIFVGISFSSLLLFLGHSDIQKVSYTAQRQTDPSLKKISKTTVDGVVFADKDLFLAFNFLKK